MKTYHVIDKYERNVNSELKHYTFEQLKDFFQPDKKELPELYNKWLKINDLSDLEKYLEFEADGMEVNYIIEEDEIENIEAMNRANEFF